MGHDRVTRRELAAGAGAALLWPLAARAQFASFEVRHDAPTRMRSKAEEDYVPPSNLQAVSDIYSRMTVPVRINGGGPYGFVVDTGANQSIISAELAGQLALPKGSPAPLNGVAGIQMAPTTQVTLQVGKRIMDHQALSILPQSGIGAVGMLGLDAVGDQALTLDFAGRQLRIETRQSNWRDPSAIRSPAQRKDGQLTLVDAYLAGVALTAFIDSGAENTIGNMALRQMAFTRNPHAVWNMIPIISSTGQTIMAELADLPALKVGGIRLPNWPVAFADLHTFEMWGMTKKPAILIGVDILSRFQSVCLDFARDEVRFRLPSASAFARS
jgi:hypothetical protein